MVEYTDVLICGSGSAGLMAALYLARCGIDSFKVLERRPGPMKMGQADGVQCRTVEIFESFGLSEEVIREAYHILEVVFWDADENGGIRRTGRTIDTKPGLSHMPHVILNQARMHELLIEAARDFGGKEVQYGWEIKAMELDMALVGDPDAYCATVSAEKDGKEELFKAKYVLACDGAHSVIRRSLGFQMVGDSTDAVWGVMDIYPRTTFPDIRRKTTIRSNAGNLLIIPREGGSLVRFYIELPYGTIAKDVRLEHLQEAARRVFQPYTMEIIETAWWSAYSIGQRLASHFHKSYRAFLTGDACHTHSPKAGQGMNVSMQDGYNIGWKLAHSLRGQAHPKLLETYVLERQKVAANLIDFDRHFTKMWSSKEAVAAEAFSETFRQSALFTAGLTATYDDSNITKGEQSAQHLAKNIVVGMRFPSAQVVRFCDAKTMQLQRAVQSDGRWRIIVFSGDINDELAASRLKELAAFLSSTVSFIHTNFSPPQKSQQLPCPIDIDMDTNTNTDSFIEPLLILHTSLQALHQDQIPSYFCPMTGKHKIRDLHKTYLDTESYTAGHGQAYETYGIDPHVGAVVIVRPDQYVSMVLEIENHEAIAEFFRGVVGQRRIERRIITHQG